MKTLAILIATSSLGLASCQDKLSATEPGSSTTATAVTNANASSADLAQCQIRIHGMVCQGCADAAHEALSDVDGVVLAIVSYDNGVATVKYDASKVNPQKLVSALGNVEMGGKRMPFEASVVAGEQATP